MKLVSYLDSTNASSVPSWGALIEESVVDLATPELRTLREAILRERIEGIARRLSDTQASKIMPLSRATLLPPIVDAEKILCVGLNYLRHAEEAKQVVPQRPSVFVRFSSSFVGHGQPVIRPRESEQFDYEAEIAVVIGRRARRVSEADALEVVAGYTCIAENSVRDWQRHSNQATPGKNFVNSGGFGPWLVTQDEAPAPTDMVVTGRLNGEVVQHDSAANMIFSIPQIIAYVSTFTELMPGDVIATGTPAGVGMSRKPPRFLREGDTFEVAISGIGELRNPVHDDF